MATIKFDVEKFNGENDFGSWRVKMQALLVHQGSTKALRGRDAQLESMLDKENDEFMEEAHNALWLLG